MSYFMMITVDLSRIPQSDPANLHVTHVRSVDLGHLHSTLGDLAGEIVLRPLFYVPELIPAMKPVLLVVELNPPCQLMLHRIHHQVVELISLVVIDDL
jgi:hypothetical protein